MRVGAVWWLVGLGGCASDGRLLDSVSPDRLEPDPAVVELLAGVDVDVDPCTDFYSFACGGWAGRVQAGEPASTVHAMYAEAWDALQAWLEEPAEGNDDVAAARRFYAACRAADGNAEAERTSLEPLLTLIDAVDGSEAFFHAVGALDRLDLRALWWLRRFPWGGGPYQVILQAASAPSHEGDVLVERIRDALARSGVDEDGLATRVAAFEQRLEAITGEDDDGVTPPELRESAWWSSYVEGLEVALPDDTRIHPRRFADELAAEIQRTAPEVLRGFLRWRLVEGLGDDLPPDVRRDARPEHRWYVCVSATARLFDVALARDFGRATLGPRETERARALFESIRDHAVARVASQEWLRPKLRVAVQQILGQTTARIAYLEQSWRPVPPIGSSSHLDNALVMRAFQTERIVSPSFDVAHGLMFDEQMFEPVAFHDRYSRTVNMGVGVLREPVFDSARPRWLDVSLAGFIMGHELHHAITDISTNLRLSDLSPDLGAPIEAAATCLRDAWADGPGFADFLVGEAMADIAGLRAAFAVFRDEVAGNGEIPPYRGLSGDQQFFAAYAQFGCADPQPDDPALLRQRDIWRFRLERVVAGVPELRAAYSCPDTEAVRSAGACFPW